ncbi:type II toxin-antitoxin system HipA family toxin [Vibrio parahaemolyticus]|uniref:HipA domain-containing protein n=1 Tax=Vibrio harveyi group TaxID=717610 RepID=UPI0003A429DB|nr:MULTISPECIES: HipA domain-containing protein [Vibrio harveyi group]MBE3754209.1 type II toxin-antitoxin system HipA family toxin [Vibrio parahaemolyticus]MDF4357306.1 HipA domain-containing protein [Vibrio parahaemolyticus]MDF4545404.1 HipA domain-containing protein [Vibrio parahaemolyticus]MDG2579279.1 HipA domain-containing protein [Vibrio parahaemolyticus]MEA5265791.1 HipA domain-containing protein [Vibrio parahaemolyticus]
MSKLQQLDVFIGTNTKIGRLTLPVGTETEFSFIYEEEWKHTGFPISPRILFDDQASPRSIENYLRNLLPEGEAFEEMIQNTTISKSNTFGLIRKLGAETSGALSFRVPNSEPEETSFRAVPDDELIERLERNLSPLVYWDGKVRLSVAGVQNKLNLLKRGDEWGFGEGKLSSNYILKFESGKAPCIAVNEFFCMTLAKLAGWDVANVELTRIGKTRTLIIERFDRAYIEARDVVQRKHVIDGCQATDLPPGYKYERQNGDEGDGVYTRDGVSFPRLLSVKTIDTVITNLKLTQWMLFNLATLNYDAHGKNISFFVTPKGLELAPFYDLVNIEAIAQEGAKRNSRSGKLSADEGRAASIPQYFAMSIGDWESEDFQNPPKGNFKRPITSYDLAEFGALLGYSGTKMASIIAETTGAIKNALKETVGLTEAQGIDDGEREHIELCVSLIQTECEYLLAQADSVPEMSELL